MSFLLKLMLAGRHCHIIGGQRTIESLLGRPVETPETGGNLLRPPETGGDQWRPQRLVETS